MSELHILDNQIQTTNPNSTCNNQVYRLFVSGVQAHASFLLYFKAQDFNFISTLDFYFYSENDYY